MESRPGKRIQVKSITPPGRQQGKKDNDTLILERLAQLCYYYPQYTLVDAQNLSINHVKILLRIARRCQAEHYLHLTKIAFAPHTDKAKLVDDLQNRYKKTIEES